MIHVRPVQIQYLAMAAAGRSNGSALDAASDSHAGWVIQTVCGAVRAHLGRR